MRWWSALWFGALLCALSAQAQEGSVVARCDFDGPYDSNSRGDAIHAGCINNYSWGRKKMSLSRDENGHVGAAQRIEVRGISSGALQFFALANAFSVHEGRFYRVSW
ncbi:MAG: hypothetical protein J7M38_10850 [Armatimonadetes bacterium]|nr:hypothetical protein [Armatimonadota bacterium]